MKLLLKWIEIPSLALIALLLVSCNGEGPAEEAAEGVGRQIDQTAEETRQEVDQAGDTTSDAVEEAGDKIESATD